MDSSTLPTSSTSGTPLPSRSILHAGRGEINPEWVLYLEGLLKVSHDKMDQDNNKIALGSYCRWCKGAYGYNEQGILHDDDCILVRIRQVVTT